MSEAMNPPGQAQSEIGGSGKEEVSPSPRVSVIILNYNGRHFLKDCLGSLAHQTFSDFEVLLADNGSTDGSVEFVRQEFPWVRALQLDRNYGFCGGNNRAVEQSKGEFVVLLNNDTKVDLNWLGELLKPALDHPDVGACASRILFIDRPEIIYAAGDSYAAFGVGLQRGHGWPAAGRFVQPEEVFSACACAALYRRAMLDEIGLLDEDFFCNYEDTDLGFRARLAGYRCLYVPRAIVYHHGGATVGIRNPRVEFRSSRNSEFVYFKNMPAALLLPYLPFHLLYDGWFLASALKHGLAFPFFKGKVAFLANLPRILAKGMPSKDDER